MLERYFAKPSTVDRIRARWFSTAIERYVEQRATDGFARSTIRSHVALLCLFSDFAAERGATTVAAATALIEEFVAMRVRTFAQRRPHGPGPTFAKDTRSPLRHAIQLAETGVIARRAATSPFPFAAVVPGFVGYLRDERGLTPTSIAHYHHYLRRFERDLEQRGVTTLSAVSPALLAAFVVAHAPQLSRTSRRDLCGCTRVLLRYCYREGLIARDLTPAVAMPQMYRLASIPRAITWDDVRRVLQLIDRRTISGRRDYAMLILLVTYGLRGCEVAALTLDDFDWKHERLRIPQRKAGHYTAYPLAGVVAAAVVDYLQHGRPQAADRHVFFRTAAPCRPVSPAAISASAARRLHAAGITIHRAGSHTFRHTCIQRLVDADVSLTTIGDYVGHRSPDSTVVYTKVALSALRAVAMGDGEAL